MKILRAHFINFDGGSLLDVEFDQAGKDYFLERKVFVFHPYRLLLFKNDWISKWGSFRFSADNSENGDIK